VTVQTSPFHSSPRTPGELLQQIELWEEQKADFCGDIMVQEFIKGIEFGVSSWLGADGFIGTPMENFEHKKCYPGEVGVGTGEQGTIAKYVKKSKLFDELLKPIEKDLVELQAFTDVDLNCIIDEEGQPWVLEFTMRPGIPIFNMQLFAHKGDPIQWMSDALDGMDTLKVNEDILIGVVLTLPDYPFCTDELKDKSKDLPIYGWEKHDDNIQPQGVRMGEYYNEDMEKEKGWITTGNYVACVTESGETIEEARKKIYKIIDDISISGLQYRDDIGEKVIKALPKLKALGYAQDW
jgi:phosphoribosylamine---glycine ligase